MERVFIVDMLRVWTGTVLVLAGGLKVYRPSTVRELLRSFLPEGYSPTAVVTSVAVVELALGSLLFAGIATVATASAAAILLFFFSFVVIKSDRACGCFGLVDAKRNGRTVALIRNTILIGTAVFVALAEGGRDRRLSGVLALQMDSLLAGLFLTLISAAAYVVLLQFVPSWRGNAAQGSNPYEE